MADPNLNCTWRKECTKKGCEKNHICPFFQKSRCTNSTSDCKFFHGSELERRPVKIVKIVPARSASARAEKPPTYKDEWAQAFEDGLVNPIILGVTAAAADDARICPGFNPSIEGSITALTIKDAATMISTKLNKIADIIEKAQQVAICFVVDTTGSMRSHIVAAKDQIADIHGGCQLGSKRMQDFPDSVCWLQRLV